MVNSSVGNVEYSDRTIKRLDKRNVPQTDRDGFKAILEKRKQQSSISDKEFLSSLSKTELNHIKKVINVIDINVNVLSSEGAHNLLVLPGEELDLNHDGSYEIGESSSFIFPPPKAPEEVKVAFDSLSSEERIKISGHALFLQRKANTRIGADGTLERLPPGDAGAVNIFEDPNFTYTGLADEMLKNLEFGKNFMPLDMYFENLHIIEKFKKSVTGF